MKMVLDEIEGKVACLVPDSPNLPPFYLSVDKLPPNASLGDVFEVEVDLTSFKPVRIMKIEGEKEDRLKRMKEKREKLLERSKRHGED